MMSMACGDCHRKTAEAQPVTGCRDCHEGQAGLHRKGEHPNLSCKECHRPHERGVAGRDTCLSCHEDKKDHNKDEGACVNCHDFRGKNAPGKARSG